MTTTQTLEMTPAVFALRDAIRTMLTDAGDTTTGDARTALIDQLVTSTTPQTAELFAMLQGRGYTPNDDLSTALTDTDGYEREAFDLGFDFAIVRLIIARDDGPSVRLEVLRPRTSTHRVTGRITRWNDLTWGVDFRWTPLFAIDAALAAAEMMAEGTH